MHFQSMDRKVKLFSLSSFMFDRKKVLISFYFGKKLLSGIWRPPKFGGTMRPHSG